MTSRSTIKHILGVSTCAIIMFFVTLASFRLAISTFHNGPASDFSFSETQELAAKTGWAVWRVLMWPGERVTKSVGAYYASSIVWGALIYDLFIYLRRRKAAAVRRLSQL